MESCTGGNRNERDRVIWGEREWEKERRQIVQKEIPHPQAAATDRQVSLSQTPLHTIISSNYSWCIASIKVNSPGLTADWIQNWMPPWVWTQEPFYIKIIMEIIILADDITHCNDLTIMIIGQWLSLDHHWPNITYSALTHSYHHITRATVVACWWHHFLCNEFTVNTNTNP